MKFGGLRMKLLGAAIIIALVVGTSVIYLISTVYYRNVLVYLARSGKYVLQGAASDVGRYLKNGDMEAVTKKLNHQKNSWDDIAYLFVQDSKGNIIAHTLESAFPPALKKTEEYQSEQSFKIRRILLAGQPFYDVAISLDPLDGTIHAGFSGSEVESQTRRIIWLIVRVVAAGMLLTGGLILIVGGRVVMPLSRLMMMARKIERGEDVSGMEISGGDEISELSKTFQKIVKDLKRSRETLVVVNKELKKNYDVQSVTNILLHLSMEDLELDEMMHRALSIITSLNWLSLEEKGGIFLADDGEPDILKLVAQRGMSEDQVSKCSRVPFGKCLCGRSALGHDVKFFGDVDERHEIRYEGMVPHGHYCAPIIYAGKTMGLLNMYVKEGHIPLPEDKDFIGAAASALAAVIHRKSVERLVEVEKEKARRYADIQEALNKLLHLSLEYGSLDRILEKAFNMLIAVPWLATEGKGSLFLIDTGAPDILILKAQEGLSEENLKACERIPLGKCACGKAAQKGTIELFDHAGGHHEIKFGDMTPHRHYCVPILYEGKPMGLINLRVGKDYLPSAENKEFLTAASNILAGVIHSKRSEEDLMSEKDKVKAYLDIAGAIIVAVGRDGKVALINKKGCDMLGHDSEYIKGRDWVEAFIPSEHREKYKNMVARAFSGEVDEAEFYECPVLTGEGEERTIAWHNTVMRDNKDEPIVFLGSGEDITELKKAAESSRLAQMGQLLAEMAHEVNNPLMIISARAQLTMMEETDNKDIIKNQNVIVEQCSRSKDIIERVLMFSKADKGLIKEVDINESMKHVIGLVEHTFSLDNVKIAQDLFPALPTMKVNDKQIQEVVLNLLRNAKEAMPSGGKITVATDCDDEFVNIHVIDIGQGIPEDIIKKIFDPFFTTKDKGTGLGLSVCYGLIKAHGGDIVYKSKVGKGTTATITLPIKPVEGKNGKV